jgi:4-diphosphocytidyl-2-C-methyl-D-erythritol kinase
MRLPAPAKLNLFLHITGRRGDGYHELQTLFQLLDYGDWLEFEHRDDGEISLHCPGLNIPTEENLVYRAAQMLQSRAGSTHGARIHLDKRLPSGGGLGGGSSNAATTLLALNRLWNLEITSAELAEIGLKLGADVPVFVHGHSAWAEGVGEKLTSVELPEQWFLVIAPRCKVSTAEVFSQQQLTRNTPRTTMAAVFERGGANDCQSVVRELYPEVDKVLIWLEKYGQAQMTGTGACVFLPLPDEAQAQAVFAQKPSHWQGFIAKGVNCSPVLRSLD